MPYMHSEVILQLTWALRPSSPKAAKSPHFLRTTREHPVGPPWAENGSLYPCQGGFL
jgi:hypothetical protein